MEIDLYYPPRQSRYIYGTSKLFGLSALYALYQGLTVFALLYTVVCFTSLNYWRKPQHSYRRIVDIWTVGLLLLYQNLFILFNSDTFRLHHVQLYYFFFLTGSTAYPVSYHVYRQKKFWLAIYLHMMLHLMANVASLCLFAGVK
jgi:hypothetical protein